MLITNFTRLENEEVCCGCGKLINVKEEVFKITQEEETINNIKIILCTGCASKLSNDISNDYLAAIVKMSFDY